MNDETEVVTEDNVVESDNMTESQEVQEEVSVDSPENAEASEDSQESTQEVEAQTSQKKRRSVQNRINQAIRRQNDESRKREQAEVRVAELEAKLSTQNNAQALKAPKLEDFDYDEGAFHEANNSFMQTSIAAANQNMQAQIDAINNQGAIQKQQATQNEFNTRVLEFADSTPDYADKVQVLADMMAPGGQVSVSQDKIDMIHKAGPQLAYYLANNLDQAQKFIESPDIHAGIQLHTLELKLNNVQKVKPSSAPNPMKPITGGGSAGVLKLDATNMSMSEYRRAKNTQERQRLGIS